MKLWPIAKRFAFASALFLTSCSSSLFPSTPTPPPPSPTPVAFDPCVAAKIVEPGTSLRPDAKDYEVDSETEITWTQTDCLMTVEINQNNQFINKYKRIKSGTKLKLGTPGSGETEIKLWREGSNTHSDSKWVWIK